jgi:hypothetical protein
MRKSAKNLFLGKKNRGSVTASLVAAVVGPEKYKCFFG